MQAQWQFTSCNDHPRQMSSFVGSEFGMFLNIFHHLCFRGSHNANVTVSRQPVLWSIYNFVCLFVLFFFLCVFVFVSVFFSMGNPLRF